VYNQIITSTCTLEPRLLTQSTPQKQSRLHMNLNMTKVFVVS